MELPIDVGVDPCLEAPGGDRPETESFRDFAERLSSGEKDAAEELLGRYSARLLALARGQLAPRLAGKVDAEDVVQSVMRTFFRRLGEGEVELRDWSSLAGLLSLLTVRCCAMRGRHFSTQRRDISREVPLEAVGDRGSPVPDREPTPDEVAEFVDVVEQLLAGLPERDRNVVEGLLAGESATEVAARLGRTERTVYRTLQRIRRRLLAGSESRDGG